MALEGWRSRGRILARGGIGSDLAWPKRGEENVSENQNQRSTRRQDAAPLTEQHQNEREKKLHDSKALCLEHL